MGFRQDHLFDRYLAHRYQGFRGGFWLGLSQTVKNSQMNTFHSRLDTTHRKIGIHVRIENRRDHDSVCNGLNRGGIDDLGASI